MARFAPRSQSRAAIVEAMQRRIVSVAVGRQLELGVTTAMATDPGQRWRARGESRGDKPNPHPGKIVHKTKRLERVERAMEIRAFALKLLGEQGRWQTLFKGPEVLRFEDSRFLIMFHVKQPVPLELRERFRIGPLGWGLYGLELWDKQVGKVMNLDWETVGAVPRVVTFKRGEWEQHMML